MGTETVDTLTGNSLEKRASILGVTKEDLARMYDNLTAFESYEWDTASEIGKQLKAFYFKKDIQDKPDKKSQTRNIMIGLLTK